MDGGPHPLPCFLEVLILNDFKSLCPEVLILRDFKSLSPEVLILVNFKARIMSKIQECEKILEVLILEELSGGTCENGGILCLRERCGATRSGCDPPAPCAFASATAGRRLRRGVRVGAGCGRGVRARREFGQDAHLLRE
jgi:hypothetical protein